MRSVFASYRVYVNGIKIGAAGKTGDSINNSKPQYLPQVLDFNSNENQIEIIMQVSNFYQREEKNLGKRLGNKLFFIRINLYNGTLLFVNICNS